MNLSQQTKKISRLARIAPAFTRRELAAAVVVVAVGAFLLFSALKRAKDAAIHTNCYSNLRCIGFAFRIWEDDNNDHFPMQALTNELGAPLYTDSTNAFRYFQIMLRMN